MLDHKSGFYARTLIKEAKVSVDDRWVQVFGSPQEYSYHFIDEKTMSTSVIPHSIINPKQRHIVFEHMFLFSMAGNYYERTSYSIMDLFGELGGVQ